MPIEYFVNFVLQSNPDGKGSGVLNYDKSHVGETPIKTNLEKAGVNFPEMCKFINAYGPIIEWMVDCAAIEKMRSGVYASLTKEQAYFEAKACFRDVLNKISKEEAFIKAQIDANFK